MRREQRARERRRRLLTIGGLAAAAVVAIAIVVIAVVSRSSQPTQASQILPTTPTGKLTVQQTPQRVPNNTGIPGVLVWDTQGWPGNGQPSPGALEHQHVSGPVKYAVLPPVGGPHNPIWMNAGVYTKPVPSERAVHDLEHGAVWIVYDPNLPADEVAQLQAFVTKQSMIPESAQAAGVANQANRYMVMSPWSNNSLPAPIVLSAWGHQLRVTTPSDPRMQRFVDMFRNSQTYTPEYGSAVDGIPIHTGGRPAADGSAQPNPAGSVH